MGYSQYYVNEFRTPTEKLNATPQVFLHFSLKSRTKNLLCLNRRREQFLIIERLKIQNKQTGKNIAII
jgi:hypothetical protein